MKQKALATTTILLTASFPVLFMYFNNAAEANFSEVLKPWGIYCCLSLGLFLICNFFVHSCLRSSLCVIPLILFFQNYRLVETIIQRIFSSLKYWHIIVLGIFLLGHIGYLIAKKVPNNLLKEINAVVSLVFGVLILINAVSAVPAIINKVNARHTENISFTDQTSSTDVLPNVYYFTLDEYSSFHVMEKYYDYDNSGFGEFLEQLGFNVAQGGQNDSHKTMTITANYLSLDYVVDDSNTDAEKAVKRNQAELFKLCKEKGYDIFGYGDASQMLGLDCPYVTDFPVGSASQQKATIGGETIDVLILKQSIFYPWSKVKYDRFAGVINETMEAAAQRSKDLENGMLYVYVTSPHEPFIFDAKGNKNDPSNYYNWQEKKYYRDQYIYITSLIEKTVKEIVKNDPDSIILIQSDHSARAASDSSLYRKWISVEDMRTFFNAVYYQGRSLDLDGLSGVNTLRQVFGDLLDISMPVIEEIPYNE